ncbi:MAG: pyruvate ferredoxin oxidoreductase, partial [Anaerolineae bacterium]
RQQVEAMRHAQKVILDVADEFAKTFGRKYGLFETYRLDDAEVAVVVSSSTAGTARTAVDRLRAQGAKVGLLKPRVFRPFPAQEMVAALRHVKAVGVMDRAISFGSMGNAGPLFLELAAAMKIYDATVPMADFVFGLGGRDIVPAQIEGIFRSLLQIAETGKVAELVSYVGVRE